VRLAYDDAQWTALSIKRERHDNGIYVQLPGHRGGFHVEMDGDDLLLTPQKSAAHRELISLLGGDLPEKPSWATW